VSPKSKMLPEIPMMEERLVLKLMESITEKIYEKFTLHPESWLVADVTRKKFQEEVIMAIAKVFALVPDGYKLDRRKRDVRDVLDLYAKTYSDMAKGIQNKPDKRQQLKKRS